MSNIVDEETDAITNAANENLWLGSGVAGAIKVAGGNSIQKECTQYVKANGNVDEGNCAVTGAGNLKCKHVIHTVGPTWSSYQPA